MEITKKSMGRLSGLQWRREGLSMGWCESECGRQPLGKKIGRYKYPFTSIPMV